MNYLRLLTFALFASLFAFVAYASPLAQRNQTASLLVALLLVFITGVLLTPAQPGRLCAITVPSALKLDRLLQTALKALKRKLLPLAAFSTVYRDVMLQGTDIVRVPFIGLDQSDVHDFDDEVGYDGEDGDSDVLSTRPVTIDKRKYIKLELTSRDIARQPNLFLEEIMVRKGERLAEVVLQDIFGVVTNANFPTPVFTGASSGFDLDSIIAIRVACNTASSTSGSWPESGRSLILNPEYDGAAVADRDILNALNFGDSGPVQEGRIRRVQGFDYRPAPIIPDNSENLVGITCLPYAVLTAFSPIEPAPEVLEMMRDYRSVTDEETGLTLEFRVMASATKDKVFYIIEVNYGKAVGDAKQLKRLVSA